MPVLDSCYLKLSSVLKRIIPKLYGRYLEKTAYIKFFISGMITGSLDLILLFLFHGVFHWGVVLSTSLAFLVSFLCSFYLQKVWAFENKEHKKVPRQLVLFILNAFLSLNINGFAMHFLTSQVQIWYILAQLIVNAVLGTLNFFIYKFIIFRTDDEINYK